MNKYFQVNINTISRIHILWLSGLFFSHWPRTKLHHKSVQKNNKYFFRPFTDIYWVPQKSLLTAADAGKSSRPVTIRLQYKLRCARIETLRLVWETPLLSQIKRGHGPRTARPKNIKRKVIIVDVFSDLYIIHCSKIYLIIPSTSCSAERPFSKLWRIKNKFRTNGTLENLIGLSITWRGQGTISYSR